MVTARTAPSIVVPLALCMASLTAAAQDDAGAEPAMAPIDAAIRVEAWPRPLAAPASVRFGASGAGGEVVDYRLWVGSGRASIGVGLATPTMAQDQWINGPWRVAGSNASSMMVGVRYQLSARSRLYVDTASWSDGELPERDVRLGFEFKSAPSNALGLARGTLFRVQWSSHSQVSLRLRSGGVAVALRSQFY